MRRWTYSLLAMSLLLVGSSTVGTSAALATTVQPQKIAIIVMENKNYDANEFSGNADQFVVSTSGNTSHATYINGTIIPESLSIKPNTDTCNYPTGYTADAGTEACTGGMFQSLRANSDTSLLVGSSAPEYAWMTQGTDANIGDGTLSACICPDVLHTGSPYSGRNGGVVGYTPNTTTPSTTCAPATDGHCTVNQNIWDVLENNSQAFNVYAEDYPGGSTSCDTSVGQGYVAGVSGPSFYYAKKHDPFLMAWDQAPNALVTNPPTPSTAPDGSQCKTHLKDFPNNTPGSSTVPVTNFDGTQSFGAVNYIIPSLCHSGHDNNTACGGNTTTDRRGGLYGADQWLSLNYEGIRKDVGQNGVVILTWDEDNSSRPQGGTSGTPAPMPTFITAGENSSGVAGTLACGTPPCTDSSAIYDQSSTLKALLTAEGSSCSALDNTQVYRGASTAQAFCNAATALPITMTSSTPTLNQSNSCRSSAAVTSLSCSWPAATTTGDLLTAVVTNGGSVTVTPPSGWSLADAGAGSSGNTAIYYISAASSRSGSETWSLSASNPMTITLEDWGNVSTGTLDTHAHGTSGSGTGTTADSGTTATTAQASEVVVAGLMNISTATFGTPTNSFTLVPSGEQLGGSLFDSASYYKVTTATGTQNTSATFSPAAKWRGVIAAFKTS